jgi:hypothetical protein
MPESCLQVDEDVVARDFLITLTLFGTFQALPISMSSLGDHSKPLRV